MTSTIDGRAAAGTAMVARKTVESLLFHQDEFELAYIHYETSDDPIYAHGVRDIVVPHIPIPIFDRRSVRLIYYFLTTKDRFDIIHWFQPRLYPFFWLAPACFTVVTMHGAGDTKKGAPFVFSKSMYNWVIRLFNKKIAIGIAGSDYSKNDIARSYWFDLARLRVVNNAAEMSFAPASSEQIARAKVAYKLPEKFFLGVGRFIYSKNIPRILLAYDEFCEKTGNADIMFVNIGAKGMEKAAVDAVIEKSPYKDRMMFLPFVEQDDLAAVYSSTYALVFPLIDEGFGLPVVEAMRCGAPAIISKTASPEFSNDDAILVDAFDQHDIARAMTTLAVDPALRDRLAEAGKKKAEEFTWEASGEKIMEIYRQVMNGAGT